MNRKLWLGISTAAFLAPGLSHALSVGSYQLNSYLNQPLSMDIPLTKVDDLSDIEIVVSLASQKEFENAGVIRSGNLSTMGFSVTLDGKGGGNIHVSTKDPINEPYMDFLVQIMWPTGRILREYTILLDPPSYRNDDSASSAPVVIEPAQTASEDYQVVEELPPLVTAEGSAQDTAPAASSTVAVSRPSSSGSSSTRATYEVKEGDTLWGIASRYRNGNDISIQQVVVAIEKANPDAFYVSGNSNFVKAGAVLQIPSEDAVRDYDARGAMQDLAEQNRYWRQLLDEKGITLAGDSDISSGSSQVQRSSSTSAPASRGEVTLLAANNENDAGASGSTDSGSKSSVGDTANELALKSESLDRLTQENQELSSRIKDLDEQLATSNKLLELRNGQIAELQEQLKNARGDDVTKTELVAGEQTVALDEEANSAEEPVAEVIATDDETDAVEADTETMGAKQAEDTETAQGEDQSSTTEQEEAEVEAPVTAADQAVDSSDESGIMQTIMDNIVMVGGGLLVIILLLVALAARRRKSEEAAAQLAPAYADGDEGQEDDFLAMSKADDDFEDVFDSVEDETQDADELAADADVADQDALEAAEAYVAYGRHQQAIDFLRAEIDKQPDRSDLKIRLLEIEKEAGVDDAFTADATRFAGSSDEVDACIERLGGVGVSALDELEQDLQVDLTSDLPDEIIADDEAGLDDFGDFELGEALSDGDEITVGGKSKPEELADYIEDSKESDDQELVLDDSLADESLELSEDDLQAMDAGADEISLDEDFSLDEGTSASVVSEGFGSDNLDADLDDLAFDLPEVESVVEEPAVDQTLVLDETPELADDALELADEPVAEELELVDFESEAEVPAPEEAAPVAEETLDLGADDNFDFLSDTDENATKLDLARAYIDMGDKEGAKDILSEVLAEGNEQQKAEAQELIAQLG